MNLGKIKIFIFLLIFNSNLFAEEKISTVPLINLDNLKPSFEEEDEESSKEYGEENYQLKEKNKISTTNKSTIVNILGLDKITAKTTSINIKIGETKRFGLLEIKAIQCGKTKSRNKLGEAAYIQVKDLSDNQNEKVFVFNGWTFSSSPSLKPIDHPVYDLWLISCDNV